MLRVNVESPCRGKVPHWIPTNPLRAAVERALRFRNQMYAIDCIRDCLRRGEAPYASHVMFAFTGILNDASEYDRALGLDCGDAWSAGADYHVFYCDYGMSPGMLRRWDECMQEGRTVVKRYLYRKGHNPHDENHAAAA
jgi:hypothetical protein